MAQVGCIYMLKSGNKELGMITKSVWILSYKHGEQTKF